ncbi:MAG: TIGR02221 family CRISPR-associated protein [Bdellovibrionota bacterium]|nr:TIGR02221 family CRISPR-associated protein [Pseudomonadota bacterium]MDY6090363.1 TIGR02221 family CRISPR-associated protein [Bdellovibrionota bacterium]
MANLFISFLGTSDYKVCRYYFDNNKNDYCDTKFIQEALISKYCKYLNEENDRIYIFVTKKAEEKNWNELEYALRSIDNLNCKIIKRNIPNGNNEADLWEIFNIVNNEIIDNDEIYLDITHAFRFIPMISCYLLNFAKIQKNITIKHINYGSIESLLPNIHSGLISDLEKDIPNIEDRLAPVYELSLLDSLFDWSTSLDGFIKYGNATKIKDTIQKNNLKFSPLNLFSANNSSKKGDCMEDCLRNLISKISDYLDVFTKAVYISDVQKALLYIRNIKKALDDLKNDTNLSSESLVSIRNDNPQIELTLDTLHGLRKEFKDISYDNDIMDSFKISAWCLNHEMYQPSITILYESTITYFLNLLTNILPQDVNNKNYLKKREFVSSLLNVTSNNENLRGYDYISKAQQEMLQNYIRNNKLVLCNLYKFVGHVRHCVNHAKTSSSEYYRITIKDTIGYLNKLKNKDYPLNMDIFELYKELIKYVFCEIGLEY